jgi:hypothetical protein
LELHHVREELQCRTKRFHSIIQAHKGNSSIWSTPWCEIWKEIYNHINLPVTVDNLPARIADLWDSNNLSWDNDIINSVFDNQASEAIKKVTIVPSDENDKIIWKPATNGDCSAKNAFQYFNHLSRHQLPPQGSRSISHDNMIILDRVWKCMKISPAIKTFIWRLIRRAIATGVREQMLSLIKLIKHVLFADLLKMMFIFSSTVLLPELSGSLPKPLCSLLCYRRNKMESNSVWL